MYHNCCNKKLSIVTICLNNLDRLKLTEASVRKQKNQNFEWIIVDGNSSDGTKEYLKSIGNYCRYISEEDSGIYDAMNKGIKLSKGDYLLFLNSGDYLIDDNVILEILDSLRGDIIVGKIKYTYKINSDSYSKIKDYSGRDVRKKYIYHKTLPHQATIFSRKLFEKYGLYNTKYKIAGDYDFYVRLISKGQKISFIDRCISVFSGDGISRDPKFENLMRCERNEIRKDNFSIAYRIKRTIVDLIERKIGINSVYSKKNLVR